MNPDCLDFNIYLNCKNDLMNWFDENIDFEFYEVLPNELVTDVFKVKYYNRIMDHIAGSVDSLPICIGIELGYFTNDEIGAQVRHYHDERLNVLKNAILNAVEFGTNFSKTVKWRIRSKSVFLFSSPSIRTSS